MKAITLWQPWATFVAMRWKTIETRTHARFKGLVGQRIAIHAGLKVDEAAFLNEFLPQRISTPLQVENLIRVVALWRGRLVCTARVVDARWAPNVGFVEREEWNKRAMCEAAGKFCLFLGDIVPLQNMIPFRGRQGIFEVPDEALKR